MMEPLPDSTIDLAKTIVGRIVPKRFSSTTLRIASSEASRNVLSGAILAAAILPPAAFKRTSIVPKRANISRLFCSKMSASKTLVLRNIAGVIALSCASKSLPASSFISRITMCAPCSAR